MSEATYHSVNRAGWNVLSAADSEHSQSYGPAEFADARALLDHRGWLPWDRFRSVLCVAAGGGQQGPLFASLGYEVTVADLSPDQLESDRVAARRYNLRLECVEADLQSLSAVLRGRHFDLVYQPVSSLYVPDIRTSYEQVAALTTPGALFYSEHWNPVQMQLAVDERWDGDSYRVGLRPETGPYPWPPGALDDATCWHYIHSLDELIGGICDAGFAVLRYGEWGQGEPDAAPDTQEHLDTYLPARIGVLARREPAADGG
jgi:SAM-dependent methyltransferase